MRTNTDLNKSVLFLSAFKPDFSEEGERECGEHESEGGDDRVQPGVRDVDYVEVNPDRKIREQNEQAPPGVARFPFLVLFHPDVPGF